MTAPKTPMEALAALELSGWRRSKIEKALRPFIGIHFGGTYTDRTPGTVEVCERCSLRETVVDDDSEERECWEICDESCCPIRTAKENAK